MYHFEIILGLIVGLISVVSGIGCDTEMEVLKAASFDMAVWKTIILEISGFFVRVIGTCAVFYGFFLCRMLGAGDIKLMAICVGTLGIWSGCLVIFFGMTLALFTAGIRGQVWKHGILLMKNQEMRLAPYIFAGFCLYMSMRGGS